MTSTREIQAKFAEFLGRRRDLGKDGEARRFAETHIAENSRLSPVEQLEIYREQFWLRHTGSLVEDFPGVGGILGQDAWNRLVEEYLGAHPPESFTLRDLGDRFAEFARSCTWLEHRELVVDMARLEWAHVEVFDADDAPPLDPTKLAAVPEDAWPGVRLVRDPGLRLLELAYPVGALRRRLIAESSAPSDEAVPLPEPETVHLAVHRRERLIHHDRLERDAFALLAEIVGGAALGAACEAAATRLGSSTALLEQRLAEWFGDWARRGYLVNLLLP